MPQSIVSQFDRKYGLPIETYRSVQNISQRNNIPNSIRWEGMIVHVIGDQSYILLGGTDDTKWEPLGGLVNVNVVDNLLSTSQTDALSANQGRVLKSLIDAIDTSVNWGEIGGTLSNQTDLNNKFNDYQLLSQKGSANGYAPLDSGAKVPIANLPDSVVGQVEYQSTWSASTNTPTLPNPPDSSTKGHYYVCSDNGTQFGISFQTGDWIISNGNAWEKVDNTDAVTSVFGRIGAVVANAGDYTFAQIGSKPTTISGYGITDAYTESEVDALLLGKLGVSAKAADSELLDGIDGSNYARTDINEQFNGTVTVGSGSTFAEIYFNGDAGGGSPHRIRYNGTRQFRIRDDVAGIDRISISSSGAITASNDLIVQGLLETSLRMRHQGDIDTWFGFPNNDEAQIVTGGVQRALFTNSVISLGLNTSVSGSVTATSFKTTNWEIVETGGVLQFKYGGVTKFEMNSSGIIEATDFKQGL